MEFKLTHFQIECLRAIRDYPWSVASNIEIAAIIRRNTKKRTYPISVASALRALLKRESTGPDRSEWIARHPPKDQWSSEGWSLNFKGREFLKQDDAS